MDAPQRCPTLLHLDVAWCARLTDELPRKLLADRASRLRALDITGCARISDKAFDKLKAAAPPGVLLIRCARAGGRVGILVESPARRCHARGTQPDPAPAPLADASHARTHADPRSAGLVPGWTPPPASDLMRNFGSGQGARKGAGAKRAGKR